VNSGNKSDPEAEARRDYDEAERLGTKQAWDDFIAKHPTSTYAELARQQLTKLAAEPPPKTTPSKDEKPDDLASFYSRGQRYALNGDFDQAIKDFTEVIRRDPKHAGALNDRCWARAITNELKGALADCNEAIRIAPDYVDALDSRGLVNLKLGKLSAAIADYDAALKIDPKLASSLYGRGLAKRRSGNVDGGNSDIDAAKAIQSNIAGEFASYGVR